MCYIMCYTVTPEKRHATSESSYITEVNHDGMKPFISYADHASESLQWGGTIESAS